MRTSCTALLLSAALVAAMPLRIRESWVWMVRARSSNGFGMDTTFRTATVVGSQSHALGRLWSLVAMDSASHRSDTGIILEKTDGTQQWWKSSSLLAWEPQPWPGTSNYFLDTLLYKWGRAIYAESLFSDGRSSLYEVLPARGDWPFPTVMVGNERQNLPTGIWNDSLGIVAFCAPKSLGIDQKWTLIAHDGHPTAPLFDSLAVPDSGTRLTWEESRWDSAVHRVESNVAASVGDSSFGHHVQRRHWLVGSHRVEPSGLVGISITQTLVVSGQRDSSDTAIMLWLDPKTGTRYAGQSESCPEPDDGWWKNATDAIGGAFRSRTRIREGASGSKFRNFQSMRLDGYLDSSLCRSAWEHSKAVYGFGGNPTASSNGTLTITTTTNNIYTTIQRKLLSIGDVKIREASPLLSTPVVPGRSSTRQGLVDLVAKFPNVACSWTDAKGATGRILAKQIFKPEGSRTARPIVVDAVFPDGTRWRGAVLR